VTDKAVRQIEAILAKDPDVDTYIVGSGTNVGLRGAGGVSVPNQGA